ncbi:hypothetical protein NK8_63210 (plasmid) [Caballeronia sp. NK8]|uniref:hypothetical protein n=1 Tax=Caballeronia sp. NK8 TaxID=140098 RepID=UPI001BB53D6A|nr:hypothetical protein [Caballeronia sp. NK8]BCQ28132.1 hypothetical protein NK8_63210 [Caballeronia sp. NK8]
MPRLKSDSNDDSPLHNAQVLRTIRMAAVSAVLFDFKAARALLRLTDAEIGRLFKIRLMKVAGLSTALNLDLRSIRDERYEESEQSKRRATPRHILVAEGKLLHASHFCSASGMTEHKLRKEVASDRIFGVTFKGDQYYPSFFLVDKLDRKDLSKIVRLLAGQSGWRRWDFFTSPNASLGNVTPLQALMNGELKQVLRAAATFIQK